MNTKLLCRLFTITLFMGLLLTQHLFAWTDSTAFYPDFDSQLLRLKVPDAFQKSSLNLEVFSDSSWQLFRGDRSLSYTEALHLLGQKEKIIQYEEHLARKDELLKEYRSRRVFSVITSVGGASYLGFIWSKGWVYQIPGYAAILVASVRLWESRQLEIQALREEYYLHSIIGPAQLQQLVDDYNFRLYQYLSNAGIQFSDS